MDPERWKQIDALLSQALQCEEAQRAAFLAKVCEGDEQLRKELQTLLSEHKAAGGFLQTPLPHAADLIAAVRRGSTAELGEGAPSHLAQISEGAADGSLRASTLGRYIVLHKLGGGGMGVVYAAYDPELDRKVALKLLRPEPADHRKDSKAKERLLREAQAMARLSHPNVIPVHDVGTLGDQVFIAMELVDGSTLAHWIKERQRSAGEILEVFLQAGKGLAAAHSAGIVHRDFKPDNVLVGRDGQVKVLDFGLARAVEKSDAPGTPALPQALEASPVTPRVLEAQLTKTGMFLGTPAYMSPEQLLGKPTDARTDQFSFCVAFYEALYGERPFDARGMEALRDQVIHGKIKDPSKTGRVPSWIRQVLLRGLRPNPGDRYASVNALLADLLRARRGRVRIWLSVGVAAAIIAIGAGAVALARSRPGCSGAERAWGDLWSTSYREAARTAFASSAAEFARVDSALQALRRAWIEMRTDACLATRARGEQSEALLDLRMQCLDDRRREVEAVGRLFQSATPAVVAHADDAIDKLTPLSRCADARALTSRVAAPSDAEGHARVEKAKELVARAKALLDTGESAAALPLAEEAVHAAQRASYKPVEAEALLLRAQALRLQLRYEEATASAHAASVAAIEGQDDGGAADAFTLLLMLQGYDRGGWEAGELWSQYARAAIARLGGDDLREADLEDRLANLYMNDLDHLDLSRSHRLKALALFRKAGAAEEKIAWLEAHQATVEALMGRLEESARLLQNAIDVQARHGRVNPGQLMNLGEILILAERPSEAQQAIQRGLEVYQRQNGQRSSYAVHHLAWALRESGRPEDALSLDREALDDFEKQGLGAYWLLLPLTGLGEDLIQLGRPGEAIAPLERAVRLSTENKLKSLEASMAQFALARALWESGADLKRARLLAASALETFRGPAQKYGSFYARHLGKVERWLADHSRKAR